ncbi:MAG TPA: aromatic ring-hydroxylating dioxygenase subunit alpha [Kofleriaceae bacterium]|jgi:choline monooxygenase|nr:aromatic ring-hydroxylating dioxygenase subunit alpha [Kofleriaceae bacterium]
MADSLEHVLSRFDDTAPIERASTIPAAWYTDVRVEALERRTVWSRSWQLVGRTTQVAEPGAFVTSEVAGEPVVVVRGNDGVLRGFFNVCRHHAAAVMTEPCGKVDRLRCPYHGWTYDLTGTLRGVPEFDGVMDFDRQATGLVPLSVASWENFVFVHLDPDPIPLDHFLGELVGQVAPLGLGALTFCERREYTLACNWKVYVDNYLDGGYHVPHLHKSLSSVLTYTDYTIENFERFCLQSSPIEDRGGDPATAAVRKGRALYYWIYPNLMLNWYEGHLDTNLVIPLGIDRTKVVFEFFFDDISEARSEVNRQSIAVSELIQNEDVAICERVQRGLGSRAYHTGRLSVRREAGENLFHKLLARDLRGGLQRPRLGQI